MAADGLRYSFPPTPDVIAHPYDAYGELRKDAPVYQAAGGEYVVSRYKDVLDVLRHPDTFSSPDRTRHRIDNLLEITGEQHKIRRQLMSRAIAPGRLRAFEPTVRSDTDEIIDAFISRGEVEFSTEFAFLLPVRVVPGLLGLGRAEQDWFFDWGRSLEGSASDYIPKDRAESQLSRWDHLFDYTRKALESRLDEPRDDLLTELLTAQRDQLGANDLDTLTADAGALLGGAFQSTADMITNVMNLLVRDDELMTAVRAERSRIPALVEEGLRVESPVQWQPRVAEVDTEIAGVPISAGSKVVILLASANRDEDVFEDPGSADIMRSNMRSHIAFGIGQHFCLGAPFARLEGRIAFEHLLDRLDDIRLADRQDASELKVHPEHRGFRSLHLTFTAKSA